MTHARVTYDQTPIQATPTSKAFWLQVADRSFKTALQSLAVFFGVGVGITAIDWKQALISTGVTVGITVVYSLLSSKLYEVENFYVDLMQRAARTFVATLIGSVVTIDSLASIDWKQALSLASSATFLSVITTFGVRNVGVQGTASMFPGAELIPVAANQVVQYGQAVNQWATSETERISNQVDDARGQFDTWMNSQVRPPQG